MITRNVKWGVHMSDDTFEWYEDRPTANRFSKLKRSGTEPTGRIIKRSITVKIEDEEVSYSGIIPSSS